MYRNAFSIKQYRTKIMPLLKEKTKERRQQEKKYMGAMHNSVIREQLGDGTVKNRH